MMLAIMIMIIMLMPEWDNFSGKVDDDDDKVGDHDDDDDDDNVGDHDDDDDDDDNVGDDDDDA